ncbi:PAP2 (acid phosphatase) superfamily protein [Beggiatoa alba B18LD]|uniref:PAP2 (Acid phosphatase) superfamily protein n=1 Tax=Beggiatoa alba B18LD TaxID=395493 RepID=I3CFX0_9GAMM|nr:phosphatase PAP2 family protein [Beggiatoa alba]EIJ42513.1 PAP2 (acid phosphatase) superfamily protein [Beggiatoa alba B18LD]
MPTHIDIDESQRLDSQAFHSRYLLVTFILLITAAPFLEWTGIDIWLQDQFYHAELARWLVDKDAPLAKFIFYDGIKKLFVLFAVFLLIILIFIRKLPRLLPYRRGLIIVWLAMLFVPAVVGGLKAVTNVPCPKDLSHYQGTYPYVTILTPYPENFQQKESIKCFPAGHASGGFALLALFFLFKTRRNKWLAVAGALTIAWSIGLYKMLIGDHFLSHTVTTMLLAWLLILIIARLVYRVAVNRQK